MKESLIVAMLLSCGLASAADRVSIAPRMDTRPKTGLAPSIRLDVKLVMVPVTVTDSMGAPFPGLPLQAFRLFEDGVEQQLKYLANEDAPISLGIVFDASHSMKNKLDQSRAAVAQFFRAAIPGDEFFLVEFNDAPQILCDFTSDTQRIENALANIQPKNWTSLVDAIYLGIHHIKRAKNARKALLVLSDGGDNHSRYTEGEMKTRLREADVSMYSIGLTGGSLIKRHVSLLRQLSEATGGKLCQVERMGELPTAVEQIGAAIRNQYLLGYASRNPSNDGLYRKIEVRLNPRPDLPRLRASWRTGYYAPPGP